MGGKTAIMFPGQGSQAVGMGRDICAIHPEAAAVFDRADQLLNRDLTELIFDGPAEILNETVNTQLAVYAMNHAAYVLYKKSGRPADFSLGHSLGEYNALVAARVIDFDEGLALVAERGSLMQEAASRRSGKMLAVLGLEDDEVSRIVSDAPSGGFLSVANYNCPGQVVVSGESTAVDVLKERFADAGAKKVVELNVSGGFHSPLMAAAADEFKEDLNNAEFAQASIPVCSNFTGELSSDPEVLRDALKQQMTGSVQWTKSVKTVMNAGAGRFVELGEGKILSGLVKRIAGSDASIDNGRNAYE
ncbi:MAG: ACP S-malonyltransferase [Actinomycetota bacterium]